MRCHCTSVNVRRSRQRAVRKKIEQHPDCRCRVVDEDVPVERVRHAVRRPFLPAHDKGRLASETRPKRLKLRNERPVDRDKHQRQRGDKCEHAPVPARLTRPPQRGPRREQRDNTDVFSGNRHATRCTDRRSKQECRAPLEMQTSQATSARAPAATRRLPSCSETVRRVDGAASAHHPPQLPRASHAT